MFFFLREGTKIRVGQKQGDISLSIFFINSKINANSKNDNIFVLCSMDNNELSRISRDLFKQVNAIIGHEAIVNIRRTTTTLRDNVYKRMCEVHDIPLQACYSGSKAEGFRFKSSDEDWMYLCRHIKVIPSSSYALKYDSNTTLLLMENEMTKPGFALLRLVTDSSDRLIQCSTQALLNDYYISSKLWREAHTEAHGDASMVYTHGPCTSGVIGETEFDFAVCLRNDIWPTNAQDCIRRLYQCEWPSLATTLEIVKDGVLFVPIGAKQSFFENTEWRMSFSLAEKRLIHAMNHTQFLCYGLLKLFLKEAMDANVTVKGLLCSYFLKTAVFWEIATSRSRWVSCTLLSRFWNCLTRLLQWINCAYCPNFFVPQNNMFEGKIEGENREKLLQYLGVLYSEVYPYQSEKFAASLPQTCRKLAAHYLVRQRNLETVCRSVPLVAHFRRTTDCAPQRARLCARTGIVCEKCATIYS